MSAEIKEHPAQTLYNELGKVHPDTDTVALLFLLALRADHKALSLVLKIRAMTSEQEACIRSTVWEMRPDELAVVAAFIRTHNDNMVGDIVAACK